MKQPVVLLLLCAGILLIACESKKERAFRLLTNDSEAYWEAKSATCKRGKVSPFKHKLVISFSTDSVCEHYWWHGDFYSTNAYYHKMNPPKETVLVCVSALGEEKDYWKLLSENMLLINGDTARIMTLTEDTLKLNYLSENCNKRVFVRMRQTNLVRKDKE